MNILSTAYYLAQFSVRKKYIHTIKELEFVFTKQTKRPA